QGEMPLESVCFRLLIRNERDWQDASEFVRRYLRAFASNDSVSLRIAALDPAFDASTIGARIERLVRRLNLKEERVADIDVSDEEDAQAWISSLRADCIDVEALEDRSPSALRRYVRIEAAV
ncbi:MAG: hypothetical protein ABI282_03225, partial [Candidatus Baltobacteraceae bacterium]